MTPWIHILRIVLRLVAGLVLLLVLALIGIGLTPFGARMVANEVASLVSTPGRTVEIGTPSGLLTGKLRIPDVAVSDELGVYARIRDIEVDWYPRALFAKTFHADTIRAGSVEVLRPPVPSGTAADTNREPFRLPVAVDVEAIDLPDIVIASAVAKRDFRLAASGSARADGETVVARFAANRKDAPSARAEADLAYVTGENLLTLKASLDEPREGLLSGLLDLPGGPAMHLTVDGAGPLSDWRGRFAAALDGNPAFTAEARHQTVEQNGHRFELRGSGTAGLLMPPAVRSLFAGKTDFVFDGTLAADGRLTIAKGSLTSSSVDLEISGTYDPHGENDLTAGARGIAGPVPLAIPAGAAEVSLLVKDLTLALKGPATAATLDLTAALEHAEIPGYRLDGLRLDARGAAIDLGTRAGTGTVTLSFEKSTFRDPNLARLAPGPFRIVGPVALSGDRIRFGEANVESPRLTGTLSGTYDRAAKILQTDVQISVAPDAFPGPVSAKVKDGVQLAGSVTHGPEGAIAVSGLTVNSSLLTASGEATLSGGALQTDLKGRLTDLSALLDHATGAADFTLSASGAPSAPDVKASVTSEKAVMAGHELQALSLTAEGNADPKAPRATVRATGILSGQVVDIDADFASENGVTSLPLLKADIGLNHLEGSLRLTPDLLPVGKIRFDLPDIALVAALVGQKATGDLSGDAEFALNNGVSSAKITASGKGIARDGLSVKEPKIDLVIADLRALAASGTVKAAEVSSGANRLVNLDLGFKRAGAETGFDLEARYDGKPVVLKGSAAIAGNRTNVRLDAASASPRGVTLKLERPSTVTIENGSAAFRDIVIQAGNGSISVTGRAGEALDLTATVKSLPLSLANAVQPSLDADGTLSGSIRATGRTSSPIVDYRLTANRLALAQTRSAGLQPLTIEADGRYRADQVRVNATANNADGLKVSGGGTAAVTGNQALNLSFSGSLPFKALSSVLAAQGFELTGTARFDVELGGTPAAPVVTGRIASSNAQLVDLRRNLAVRNLALIVNLNRNRATIERLNGTLSTGGTVAVSGAVGIGPGTGYPADLTIALNKATYVDGKLVSTVADGRLTVTGPVLSGPTLSGRLSLGRSAITIPQKLPASLSTINVQHVNESKAVAEQMADVRSAGAGSGKGASSADLALDLTFTAPRIFVQGRGIDAELGGDLTLSGTASAPVVSGGFKMQRGRMTILSRRLDFTSGTIGFGGDLTPQLDMMATSDAGSTTVTVTIAGPANDPAIAFSSNPALPQDEVLAQLIFQQSLSRLSALQIAQLADAAAQLAGGRSTSLLQGLRSNLGIDDLDVTSDANGEAQVRAGKYLNDKTYIQIEQGGSTGAKASINLDVGRGIKLKGEAGSNGGAAGIFYEKEY